LSLDACKPDSVKAKPKRWRKKNPGPMDFLFLLSWNHPKQSNFTPSSAAKPEAAIGAGPIKKCSEELNGKVDS
jgi:hypothetical protein